MLALAAPHMRALVAPQSITPGPLLEFEPSFPPDTVESKVVRHRHYFRREALYELVWTAPVYEIAARLGVSDVGLAKLCRRANIPMPGRGYWARVDAGQVVSRAALQPAPGGLPELLRIRGKQPSVLNEAAALEHEAVASQALRAA